MFSLSRIFNINNKTWHYTVVMSIRMIRLPHKMKFGSSLPPVVCRRAHVLFTLFVCVYWCPTHIVLCFCFIFLPHVYTILPVSLCFCFIFLPHVYTMLPVSLDCSFLIPPPVLSDVYLLNIL
jgi:hypothetical protein